MITIAVAGKGGTGKTTVSAMILRWLSRNRSTSLLAVDGDANMNLNDVLGLDVRDTVGSVREEMRAGSGGLPGGMTKQQFLEYKIQSGLVETSEYDFIAMGRPEGPGCYCYANNLLRDIISTLSANYSYVVIDNEAGLEHISRGLTARIDRLVLTSDPAVRGIKTLERIIRLSDELGLKELETHVIINRVSGEVPEGLKAAAEALRPASITFVPEDTKIREWEQAGQPIWPGLDSTEAYLSLSAGVEAIVGTKAAPRAKARDFDLKR
jgi:CO dehydrogenase maturation factor